VLLLLLLLLRLTLMPSSHFHGFDAGSITVLIVVKPACFGHGCHFPTVEQAV